MASTRVKTENLSCRISPEHKKMIERAARRSGFSLSDFVVHTLVATASALRGQGIHVALDTSGFASPAVFRQALEVADRGYVLSSGRLVLEGSASELRANPEVRKSYLGG